MNEADQDPAAVAIARALDRLGAPGASMFTPLTSGQSGARTNRVELVDGRIAVLKTTTTDAPPQTAARGRREAMFYRELAPLLATPTPPLLRPPIVDADGTAILLLPLQPAPPATRWTPDMFVAIATSLAALSIAVPVPALTEMSWLRPPPLTTATETEQASSDWTALRAWTSPELITDAVLALVDSVLTAIAHVDTLAGERPVLCHGDCHTENVLIGGTGELVLADWQEVGWSGWGADLSFLCQRALLAEVPVARMIDAYLSAIGGGAADRGQLVVSMAAHELRTTVLHWPVFLPLSPPRAQAHRVRRVGELVSQLGLLG